jgi:hypothetical protein
MLVLVCVSSMGGVVFGSVAAAAADVFPAHRRQLQRWGASLVVGSVALIGLTFPLI